MLAPPQALVHHGMHAARGTVMAPSSTPSQPRSRRTAHAAPAAPPAFATGVQSAWLDVPAALRRRTSAEPPDRHRFSKRAEMQAPLHRNVLAIHRELSQGFRHRGDGEIAAARAPPGCATCILERKLVSGGGLLM